MTTQEIFNYRKVNDDLITGGQPTAEQLKSAAEEGFETVINLATFESGHSLLDEAGIVRSLGMAYYPIPVDWENPTIDDFKAFEDTLKTLPKGKTLIHCAANYRVTAFYGLYAMKNLGWSEAQADDFRRSIWRGSNYPVWENFIRQVKMQMFR